MKLLNKNSKADRNKLLGVLIPPWVYSYVNLYILAKGVTKTDIARPLFENWVTQHKTAESDVILLQEILARINQKWSAEKCSKQIDFATFKKDIEKELKNKGIPTACINSILKEIKA